MKAIKDIEGFQFVFYSNEGTHTPHIHVKKGGGEAIFELTPKVSLRENWDMKKQEIKKAQKLVNKNLPELIQQYNARHNR